MSIKVAAPAKINLTLDVTGRLENGYHTVEMVMQTIDLTDTVEVCTADALSLTVGEAPLPADESNTAWKAACLYSEKIGVPPYFAITLHKNIPMQAGLAGGSTDAAGVLVALNAMFNNRLSTEELCKIGAKVGADVPFCILGGTMLATGIGTDLAVLPSMPHCHIVVAKPFCGVSTAAAYAAIDSLPYPVQKHSDAMKAALSAGAVAAVGKSMHNRFAEVLQIGEVETLVSKLRAGGALGACMTGSGSAVIGVFAEKQDADSCAETLRPLCEKVCVCRPWRGGPKILV